MKALRATLQLINSGNGPNPLATLSIEYGTFKLDVDREQVETALKYRANELAIDLGMQKVMRLPVQFEEVEV